MFLRGCRQEKSSPIATPIRSPNADLRRAARQAAETPRPAGRGAISRAVPKARILGKGTEQSKQKGKCAAAKKKSSTPKKTIHASPQKMSLTDTRKCAVSRAYKEGRKQSLARGESDAAARVAGAVALKAAGVAWDAAHA